MFFKSTAGHKIPFCDQCQAVADIIHRRDLHALHLNVHAGPGPLILGHGNPRVVEALTRAVREGALCYLDEVVEARQDTVVVLHPLTDHRRILPIDKTGETIEAAPGFCLIVSYNPGYQRMLKDLKPSTRQRFVALEFGFPEPEAEAQIVARESGVQLGDARALVQLAQRLRGLHDRGLAEVPSTRLLIAAAQLAVHGIDLRRACWHAVVAPLSDEPSLVAAMRDLVDATFV